MRSSRSSNSSFGSRRTNGLSKRAVYIGIDKAQLAELCWPHTQLRASGNNESITPLFFLNIALDRSALYPRGIDHNALNNLKPDTAVF